MAGSSRASGSRKKNNEVPNRGAPSKIGEVVRAHLEDRAVAALQEALERRREVFTFELACRMEALLRDSLSSLSPSVAREKDEEWVPIESLSALRALVGGRFQQLKQRWIDAGLPLREHRGDRSGSAELDEHGWAELTNWILRQGYEVRRAGPESDHLFELRAIPKR